MEILIAAISLGLLGSFHCIGMCGPIALALPVHTYKPFKKYIGIISYNLGRAITYSILGAMFGLLGQSFYLGGFQQNLSIVLGIVMLLIILFSYTPLKSKIKFQFLNHSLNSLKNTLGKLFNKKGIQFLFLIGLLNGLLPCGFVYIAIAGATATSNYLNGALFMFLFGMGTLPVMLSLSVIGQFISVQYRNAIHKSVPILISFMAILLIVRGLNLGIPLLSPQYKKEIVCTNNEPKKHVTIKCCVPSKNKK
ncbi:MAG: sulfite exporter TauE/SafE family protein [Bacteroidota bacterium]|nr:sulfite exporter TauE/SafE family protein [Bacteroidota bacterium]MDP3145813.1 sulfite exporter TauE/SafE family protein [Bacteroidota bacterium]MDP3558447.1 sulfite exporter TauE/SafE family protein [Bacteroidota bacterium]